MTDPVSAGGQVVRPGDTLVVYTDQRLSVAEADSLRRQILAQLPGLADVVLLSHVAGLAVYRPAAEPDDADARVASWASSGLLAALAEQPAEPVRGGDEPPDPAARTAPAFVRRVPRGLDLYDLLSSPRGVPARLPEHLRLEQAAGDAAVRMIAEFGGHDA